MFIFIERTFLSLYLLTYLERTMSFNVVFLIEEDHVLSYLFGEDLVLSRVFFYQARTLSFQVLLYLLKKSFLNVLIYVFIQDLVKSRAYLNISIGPCKITSIFIYFQRTLSNHVHIYIFLEDLVKSRAYICRGPCPLGHVLSFNYTTLKPECRCEGNFNFNPEVRYPRCDRCKVWRGGWDIPSAIDVRFGGVDGISKV